MINIPVCGAFILAADRIALLLKGSSRASRFVDWLFAGVLRLRGEADLHARALKPALRPAISQ